MKDKIVKILNNIKTVLIQFGWLLAIVIPIFIFVNWAIFSIVNAQKTTINATLYSGAEQELNEIDLFVTTRFNSLHDDIHVILNASETNAYLSNPTALNVSEYQALLYRIAESKMAFTNLMMVDTNGDVLYQVHRDGDNLTVLSGDLGSLSSAYYYTTMTNADTSKLFISQLYMKDNEPVMTLARAMIYDDVIESYLVIDYDVKDFLSVLNLYTSDQEDYFGFGLINNGVIWEINQVDLTLEINENLAFRDELFERIFKNNYVVTYNFDINELSDHFYVESSNKLRFYVTMNFDAAVQDSESVFLKNPAIIAIVTNMITGVLVSFLAYMIRIRKDDRLLINANMYLSVQNQDSIIIVNRKLRIIYVNPAFEKLYGFTYDEAYFKKVIDLIGIRFLQMKLDLKKLENYEGNSWTKNKSDIYILNYLRIKQESSFANSDKNYICIQSDSHIDLADYKAYVMNKQNTIDELSRLFDFHHIDINQSTIFLIEIKHTDTIVFSQFLQRNLNRNYFITIPQQHHVMIYANIDENIFKREVTHIDNLIETYRFQKAIHRDLSHKFVIVQANEQINKMPLLIEAALASLAYAKEYSQARYLIYRDDMKERMEREKHIENELLNGFSNHEFYLEYQVIKDLKNKTYMSAEALLRWENKTLGRVSPGDFVPVIENSFYINRLSLMVLSIAIYDFEKMVDDLDKDFRISINLTQFDLNNDYIIEQMIFKINQSHLKPKQFIFEITERQYINAVDQTNAMIDKLHESGILIAVDDFGTGYSSINLLKKIKADYVKIDRSYIKNYPAEDNGQMLDTLVKLVKQFEKPIIAEGVETKAHIDYCLTHGIAYAQGYYIQKPMMPEQFKKILIK